MKQKFISNLFFLILANVIIKPFWIFGIDRHLQNSIDTSSYGAYFAVFNFSFLLHVILDGGINNYNNIEVSRDASYLKKNISNIFYLKLILSFVYILVTFSIVSFTSFDSNQIQMLIALLMNMILLNLILFFRSNVAALQYFKTDSLLSILDRFLAILFCVLLIVYNQFSLFNFIYAQTLALLMSLLVCIYVVYVIGKPSIVPFNFTQLLSILKESYPFAILGVLMSIYYRVDAVMIEQLLPNGKEQAGVYAASYRILDALNMIAFLVASLLLPLFSKSIKHKEIYHLKKLVLMASGILVCMSIVVFVVSYFHSNWILSHLYIHADASWDKVFWVLLFSFIPISLTYVFGTFLTANKNLFFLNILSLIALVINVILNFILIPIQYALGACIATGVTQVLVVSLQIIYVLYILYYKPEKLKYETEVTTIS